MLIDTRNNVSMPNHNLGRSSFEKFKLIWYHTLHPTVVTEVVELKSLLNDWKSMIKYQPHKIILQVRRMI